jgi:hypothetical protein
MKPPNPPRMGILGQGGESAGEQSAPAAERLGRSPTEARAAFERWRGESIGNVAVPFQWRSQPGAMLNAWVARDGMYTTRRLEPEHPRRCSRDRVRGRTRGDPAPPGEVPARVDWRRGAVLQ